MKTKYILHGGMMRWQSKFNKLYYQEMVKGVANPKVLLVYFARKGDEIPGLIERDKNNFTWANPGVKVEQTVAIEKNFVEQVRANDVILLVGGETQKLIDTVKRTEIDLKKAFEGKIISGSSAGACLLAEWFYNNSGKEIFPGLGLLPVAVWTHYRPEKGTEFWISEDQEHEVMNELRARIGDSKLALLHEQEMVVFERQN